MMFWYDMKEDHGVVGSYSLLIHDEVLWAIIGSWLGAFGYVPKDALISSSIYLFPSTSQ